MKNKKYFIVKVEGTVPVQMEFRVHAENEEEAYKTYELNPHLIHPVGPPKYDIKKLKKIKVMIREQLSLMFTWARNF